MEKDAEREDLGDELAQWSRRPAAEIMMATFGTRAGPRLERARSGTRRWVSRSRRKPDLRRFTNGIPMM